jgi:hypothetical protein
MHLAFCKVRLGRLDEKANFPISFKLAEHRNSPRVWKLCEVLERLGGPSCYETAEALSRGKTRSRNLFLVTKMIVQAEEVVSEEDCRRLIEIFDRNSNLA